MTTGHLLAGSTAIPYAVGDGEGAVRLARRAGIVAVDIETAGLGVDAYAMRSVQIGTPTEAHVLRPEEDRAAIIDALAAARRLIFHNSPFDVPILVGLGFLPRSAIARVWDTLVASRMASPSEIGGHDLGAAFLRHLPAGSIGDKKALHTRFRQATGGTKAEMFRLLGPESEPFCQYAANDVVGTAMLAEVLPEALRRHTLDHPFPTSGDPDYLSEREQTINRMMLDRTCVGIAVDYAVVDELKAELFGVAQDADELLYQYDVDVEALSPPKVKDAVMATLDEMGLIPGAYPRLMNGKPTADARWRSRLSHPLLDALEARSKALRFTADYANKMLPMAERDDRIHPEVAIATAVTGRMSIKNPPLQQYPERVRRMLRFDTDATSLDWSSIEPVLFGNLAGEVGLVEPFEQGGDLYEPIADLAGVARKTAKVILLAQFYGQGKRSLAWRLGVDEEEAGVLIARVMGPLTSLSAATKGIRRIGDKFGKAQTLSGRICPIQRDPASGNRSFMGYLAVNYVVQGGAYDMLAEALFEMHRRGLDDALYLAVHDELVVAADAADDVEQIMRTPPPALIEQAGRVPVLRVGRSELGRHWLPKEDG